MPEASSKTDNVASVLKVFAVLETLAQEGEASLAVIAQRALTSKSTTHRVLQTMVDLGYVRQNRDTEHYALSTKLLGVAVKALNDDGSLMHAADRAMATLARATGEAINLGVMDEHEQRVVYIHQHKSSFSLSLKCTLGMRNPLHCTALGKALLAWRAPEEIAARMALMDFAPHAAGTITDPRTFRAELDLARARGYAEEIEENEAGVRCMAAPLFDHIGRPVAAVSMSFLMLRFDEARHGEYSALLREVTRAASADLGYAVRAPQA
ncbi:Transcriptional regulator KdgR [Aquimixticola soesokkakensis]|uniref:Transcriptional regulator KdgR n=1 Tax=Aquimixticola soesokkakensis TaxID=1519096 RepID=A0A1Y5RRY7_9RHOB|nr:IclR family transcriptional regulator C-terminal domain-containing protein [Aquimixticola soesokkakensis]SLN23986.1 Transcriptional regulator KdgR [Aquimixticola soesokkakensis]